MNKKVGFLGCGKIGKTILQHLLSQGEHTISFVQDIFFQPEDGMNFPVISESDESLLAETDLVVECANADVLKANFDQILMHCDLMMFSVTAFCDAEFEAHAKKVIAESGHKVYLPHGAILGVDGIFDGRELISSVSIVTTKNPPSLGRTDTERTVVYDGPTREACRLYPRNVNVHATIALASLGFDKTRSTIISDPSVNTNAHKIVVDGEGVHFELDISSFTTGGVTGKYTPYSACGSVDRVLQSGKAPFRFV